MVQVPKQTAFTQIHNYNSINKKPYILCIWVLWTPRGGVLSCFIGIIGNFCGTFTARCLHMAVPYIEGPLEGVLPIRALPFRAKLGAAHFFENSQTRRVQAFLFSHNFNIAIFARHVLQSSTNICNKKEPLSHA